MGTVLVVGSSMESRATLRFLWLLGAAGHWTIAVPTDLRPLASDGFCAFLGDRDYLLHRWRALILRMLARGMPCKTLNPLKGMIGALLNGPALAPTCWDLTLLAADQQLHDWRNNIPRDCHEARVELEVIFSEILDPLIELGALGADQVAALRGCCAEKTERTRWRRLIIDEVEHVRTLLTQALR